MVLKVRLSYLKPWDTTNYLFGPLLFIVYINNLLNLNCDRLIFCFADDASTIVDINKNHIHNKSTHVLSIIKTWLDNNLLELNLSKTCFVNMSKNNFSHVENNSRHIKCLLCQLV